MKTIFFTCLLFCVFLIGCDEDKDDMMFVLKNNTADEITVKIAAGTFTNVFAQGEYKVQGETEKTVSLALDKGEGSFAISALGFEDTIGYFTLGKSWYNYKVIVDSDTMSFESIEVPNNY